MRKREFLDFDWCGWLMKFYPPRLLFPQMVEQLKFYDFGFDRAMSVVVAKLISNGNNLVDICAAPRLLSPHHTHALPRYISFCDSFNYGLIWMYVCFIPMIEKRNYPLRPSLWICITKGETSIRSFHMWIKTARQRRSALSPLCGVPSASLTQPQVLSFFSELELWKGAGVCFPVQPLVLLTAVAL